MPPRTTHAAAPRRTRTYQRGPHIYRRGKVYYARGGSLPRDGVSLHTTNRAEAEERFRKFLHGQSDRRDAPTAAVESSLATCVSDYLAAPHGYTRRTKGSAKNRLESAVVWFADHHVKLPSEITPQIVDRWITERSKAVSRRTVNRDLRAMRVCLRWSAEREKCTATRALDRELREPSRSDPREIPSPEMLARQIVAVRERHAVAALAVRALVAIGCRIEELRRLTLADVRGREVLIRPEAGSADTAEPTKGYGTRRVLLTESAAGDVRAFLEGRGKYTVSEGWLRRHMIEAAKACGDPPTTPHDLRRLFVTAAYRAGVSLDVIAKWVGHKSTRTTEGYLGQFREDDRAVAPAVLGAAVSLPNPVPDSGVSERIRGTHQRAGRAAKSA